jgi:AraC family transcriptional activator of pobA
MAKQDIKSFALYGEFGELDNPDFVHIETIASRSQIYDGTIRPHIHNDLFQVIYIRQGQAKVTLEKLQHDVDGPCAITIAPGIVHGFQFQPDTDGHVLTVAGSLPLSGADERGKSLFEVFYRAPLIINFFGSAADSQSIADLLGTIAVEHAWPRFKRTLMLEWQVQILLLRLHRQLLTDNRDSDGTNPGRDVLNRFRTLVENHYREHWEVQAYADRLGLSEHHLTRLCRENLHKTPLEIIHHRVVLEAERKLIYTIDPVSMIAYELGFKDPAYFSRLFKRKTGTTPGAYRRQRGLLKMD